MAELRSLTATADSTQAPLLQSPVIMLVISATGYHPHANTGRRANKPNHYAKASHAARADVQ